MKNLVLTLLCYILSGISYLGAQVFKCDFSTDSLSIGPVICVDSTVTDNQYLQFIVTSSIPSSGTQIQNIPAGSFIKCLHDDNFYSISSGSWYIYGGDTCIVQIQSDDCADVGLDIEIDYYDNESDLDCDSTFMNVLFSPVDSIEIGDPCNCNDPDNILDMAGNIILFRDILTVNFANPDDEVTLSMGDPHFQDENGVQIPDGTVFTQTSPAVFELEFYRPPGTSFSITIQRMFSDMAVDAYVFSPEQVCNSDDCESPPIPTLGTWALIILGVSLSILALVGMRHRNRITA